MRLQLESILQQKMTRKEFLQYAGSLVLVVLGFSTIVKALQRRSAEPARAGYGISAYGR